MVSIAKALDKVEQPIQVIFLCGENAQVREAIDQLPTSYPKRTFGFVRRVDHLMEMADVMIGKPGPGTTFEALAKGLPVLLERNGGTLPQEIAVANYVVEQGFGRTYRNHRELLRGVEAVLADWSGLPASRPAPFRSDNEIRAILDFLYPAQKCVDQARNGPSVGARQLRAIRAVRES
ncbi:glycosyltransferase [Mycobacterium spongiae]|nr:glycosyltransferase [Mycobacterium spongiae]